MLGIFLFFNCFFVGYMLVKKVNVSENRPFFSIIASIISGIIFCGISFYLFDLLAFFITKTSAYTIYIYIIALTILNIYWFRSNELIPRLTNELKAIWKDKKKLIVLAFFLAFCIFFTFKSFYTKDGNIMVADGAWGDIMYHHAYVTTIAADGNIPATYPYFANHLIAYHFMFNYFSAVLARAGMSSVFALNFMSIVSLFSLFTAIIEFSEILFKKIWIGVWAGIFLILHGALSFFTWIKEPEGGFEGITSIFTKVGYLGYEAYENWGLFNLQVFKNQRHFPFALVVILIFTSFVFLFRNKLANENVDEQCNKLTSYPLKTLDWKWIFFIAAFIGLTPYWNMIATICTGMFLFFFALLALCKKQNRLFLHLLFVGIFALILVLPQLLMIKSAGSSLVGYPKFFIGYFIGEFKLLAISTYYLKVLGIKLIIYLLAIIFIRKKYKWDMAIFCLPLLLANIVQLGIVQYDNNKLMWVTLVFVNIYAAWFINCIFNNRKYIGRIVSIIAAVLITFTVTISGVVDFFGVVNGMNNLSIAYDNSPTRQWLQYNTPPGSIFLTYTRIPYGDNIMTQVNLSGRLLYAVANMVDSSCDIAPRLEFSQQMYEDDSIPAEEKIRLLQQEKINYVTIDPEVRINFENLKEDFFINNLELVYQQDELMIFQVP